MSGHLPHHTRGNTLARTNSLSLVSYVCCVWTTASMTASMTPTTIKECKVKVAKCLMSNVYWTVFNISSTQAHALSPIISPCFRTSTSLHGRGSFLLLCWSALSCSRGYLSLFPCALKCVYREGYLGLTCVVDWTWWSCEANRLEIWFFISILELRVFFRLFENGISYSRLHFWRHWSWESKKCSEASFTLAYYNVRKMICWWVTWSAAVPRLCALRYSR